MRRDINKLAETYDLPESNGQAAAAAAVAMAAAETFRTGQSERFTAEIRKPAATITMNIDGNGAVRVTFENGSTVYATING